MEHEESRLLADYLSNPTDERSRDAYVAWLQSRDHVRGEYLALEIDVRGLDEADVRYRRAKARLRVLRASVDRDWRLAVTQAIVENCGAIDAPEGMFEFQCPLFWNQLRPTEEPTVRYCESCRQHVHLSQSLTEAQSLAERGACVAIDLCAKPAAKPKRQRDDNEDDLVPKRRVLGRLAASKLDRLTAYPSKRIGQSERKLTKGKN